MTSLLLCLTSTSGIVGYILEKYFRKVYKRDYQIKFLIEKTQSVLEILLPEFVIERVKAGVRYIAEDKGNVSILFCDICNFEKLCEDYQPIEFSSLLHSIFSIFDSLCDNHGVAKIETVGKTYMACAGLLSSSSDLSNARLAVNLALSMINEVEKIQTRSGMLHVKIGIHSGSVIAGVVGSHKPQFSLVGDTVNTASRMCSTLEFYNSIQISKETFEAIGSHKGITFTPNVIIAKGKGEMSTYIVTEDHNASDTIQHFNSLPISHKISD